jgi:predicted O-methyltransferase YrrM
MGLGIGSTIDRIEKMLSPSTAAKMRYKLAHRVYFYPFGTAMNGQTSRLEMTRQILYGCGIEQVVETGTFRGTTTEWLASFGLPVTTVESNLSNYHFAKLRLASRGNVQVELGNSSEVLQKLAERMDTSLRTFFYLDAHWEDYLPLHDELKLITSRFARPVVLVDDFEVPGDPGYGFDDYGPGKALTAEYLHGCLPPGMKVFYPSTPASQETGRRRGWVVVTPDAEMAAWLGKADLLRTIEV